MVKYSPAGNGGAAPRIVVCVNRRLSPATPSCAGRGSERLVERLRERAADRRLGVVIDTFECFGQCAEGPNARVSPGGPFLRGLTESDADRLLDAWVDFSTGGGA